MDSRRRQPVTKPAHPGTRAKTRPNITHKNSPRSERTLARSQPSPILHAGDYAAWYKHATGEWIYHLTCGQITSRRTGRLVPFRVTPDGYLEVRRYHVEI